VIGGAVDQAAAQPQAYPTRVMRIVVPSVTLMSVGVQIGMGAFLSSVLDLRVDKR